MNSPFSFKDKPATEKLALADKILLVASGFFMALGLVLIICCFLLLKSI